MKKVKNYWLVKKRRKFGWRKFLKEFRINERMAADFFGVERRTIAKWRGLRSIPVEHLTRLEEMNEAEAEKLRRWVECDLAALQARLSYNEVTLAHALNTSAPNVRNWKKQKRIPRTYLDAVLTLEKTT